MKDDKENANYEEGETTVKDETSDIYYEDEDNDEDGQDVTTAGGDAMGSSEDGSNNSSFLLNPNSSLDQADAEGIQLLRQIFPDESTEALRALHYQRVHQNSLFSEEEGNDDRNDSLSYPMSPLGRRILGECQPQDNSLWQPAQLPDNFLRLPTSVAVRRAYSCTSNGKKNSKAQYEFISDLEQQCLQEHMMSTHENSSFPVEHFSVVVERHTSSGGLGMKLQKGPLPGTLQVHALLDLDTNPSLVAGVRPNDLLIGINGSSFVHYTLQQAVQAIQNSPNPIVLHLQRPLPPALERNTSLLDTTSLEEVESLSSTTSSTISKQLPQPSTLQIHPLAIALSKRGLINSKQDEKTITKSLLQFTERARQWESMSCFRIHPSSHRLVPQFDVKDLPPDMASMVIYSEDSMTPTTFTPSTPPLSNNSPLIPIEYLQACYGKDEEILASRQHQEAKRDGRSQRAMLYPGIQGQRLEQHSSLPFDNTIFIPLYGVRKALSARIVNTFVEESTRLVAYTIWVYDVESGAEWYAPIRYFQDFCDLRAATLALDSPSISALGFPKTTGWGMFSPKRGADEPAHVQETKCRQLEQFLRGLCSLVYVCQPIHPDVAEISIHVQSFLGVEAGLAEQNDFDHDPTNFSSDSVPSPMPDKIGSQDENVAVKQSLKKAIQRYTWRLFLLNTMRAIVNDFVETVRARGPKLQEIEALEAQGRATLKARAMGDLERIRAFLDQLVDLILDGSMQDLDSMTQRGEYVAIRKCLDFEPAQWERLVREAVREQVEIEVYVPLRSVVSRLLVNGWRHEDMEVQFKVKVRKQKTVPFSTRIFILLVC